MFSVDKYMSPAVLDWVVGNDTCQSFNDHSNKSYYACGDNTKCIDQLLQWYEISLLLRERIQRHPVSSTRMPSNRGD
ncbi:hypothetical protein LguiB_028244 [Lonicera macranthoides]